MKGVLMRRKDVERRSKKYAAVQNVSVVGWYMDAEYFHQKYKARAVDKKRMSPSSKILAGQAARLRYARRRSPAAHSDGSRKLGSIRPPTALDLTELPNQFARVGGNMPEDRLALGF
jgi:hypothetical protein